MVLLIQYGKRNRKKKRKQKKKGGESNSGPRKMIVIKTGDRRRRQQRFGTALSTDDLSQPRKFRISRNFSSLKPVDSSSASVRKSRSSSSHRTKHSHHGHSHRSRNGTTSLTAPSQENLVHQGNVRLMSDVSWLRVKSGSSNANFAVWCVKKQASLRVWTLKWRYRSDLNGNVSRWLIAIQLLDRI